MEHGMDKTGPARDDMMKKQLRSQMATDRSLRADESRDLEPAGEDQPAVAPAPDTAYRGGTPHGMSERDVGIRSELAQYLGRSVYPAERGDIIRTLRRNHAPDRLVSMAEQLPAHHKYSNVQGVAESLGLGTEDRRS
ncbi:hypothetical protein ADL22_00470 [Streptomyces sp. NRRL F-4489]|uniref:DUF2795 domain-containing protein n=1 Tax=Streptomyces sp. NRRL F-4489 TaxID=1609095 RepID=UPI000748F6DC|nr:DUF2795 domain-containing protein [Streptomyces sp. NRRL F-4489]KUL55403.1 hypothetical protein ADL22_00470 [Streptomyces sp. NRRL F-4489]